MKFRPLGDRLVVRRDAPEDVTPGGLIMPTNEEKQTGVVLSVGRGTVLEDGAIRPLDVSVGDRVLFSKYGGTDIKIDGDGVIIFREADLLGVFEESSDVGE